MAAHGVSIAHMENLKQGKDIVLDNGTTIENHRLTFDPDTPIVNTITDVLFL